MEQGWHHSLVQSIAAAVMGLGIVVFTLCALGSVGILMEGVTRRVGEGEVAPPESPEQTRVRLAVIGVLLGGVTVGWTLARLGDHYRRPVSERRRPRALRVAGEVLMLLGGVGLGLAVLVGWGHRVAVFEVGEDYRRVAIAGAVVGPALLGLGWALHRRAGRDPV